MINLPSIDSHDLVAKAIAASGRTKLSISDESGIPYPTLNRKLKGQVEFTFRELYLLALTLRVPPHCFTPTLFVRPVPEMATA